MERYQMTFTRHFLTQLDSVLKFYAGQYVGEGYCYALLDLTRAHLYELLHDPVRNSWPTDRPRIRYFMVFDINITFHIQQGRITILNISF